MHDAIVACARSWVGTRFHHQGRLKKSATHKGGVDCLGLLVGISNELELGFSQYDEIHYSHYPDTVRLRNILSRLMREIPLEGIEPADVLLFNIDGNPQHLGIVSRLDDALGMIHAYAPARSVVEHALDAWWKQKTVAAFRIN